MSINVFFTNSLNELKIYKSSWEKLCELQYDNLAVLNQWDYFQSLVLNHPKNDFTVALITLKENNELIGIFPLRILNLNISDNCSLKVAVSFGAIYCPYLEYIVHPLYKKAVWEAFFSVSKIYLNLDGIVLGPLHETSLNYVYLLENLNRNYYNRLTTKNLYQINPQMMDYETYKKTRSSTTIKDAQRGRKQLEKLGTVNIIVQTSFDNVQKSIDFHINKMKEKFKDKILYDNPDNYGKIFLDTFSSMDNEEKSSKIEITDLLLDNDILASTITLKYKNRNLFILTAYNKDYAKFSVSKILLDYNIEKYFKNNEIFCFGAGDYAYKKSWSTQTYNLNVITYFFNEKAKELWSPYANWKYIGNIIKSS